MLRTLTYPRAILVYWWLPTASPHGLYQDSGTSAQGAPDKNRCRPILWWSATIRKKMSSLKAPGLT